MSSNRSLLGPAVVVALAAGLAACSAGGFDKPLTLSGRVVEPQTLERGRDLYNRYCATCHGIDGKAQTSQARALDPKPRDFAAAHFKHKVAPDDGLPTDAEMSRIIKNGVPGTGMPAWPNLDDKDLDAVIQYIKTFSPRWQEPPSEAPAAPPTQGRIGPRPTTIGAGNRGLRTDVTDPSTGATIVLPAPNDAASFRAAYGPRQGTPLSRATRAVPGSSRVGAGQTSSGAAPGAALS